MTSGYSGTPLPKKLGIKPGHAVVLADAPAGFEQLLGDLPEPVELQHAAPPFHSIPAGTDILLLFVKSVAALRDGFMETAPNLKPDAALWVAWPKRASGIETDMTEDRVREVALPRGLVDNKVCAIDETWSGLRLVVRKENRPSWPAAFSD